MAPLGLSPCWKLQLTLHTSTRLLSGHFEVPLTALIQAGDFQKTEVLLGANTDEGTYFLIYFLTHLFKLKDNVS